VRLDTSVGRGTGEAVASAGSHVQARRPRNATM